MRSERQTPQVVHDRYAGSLLAALIAVPLLVARPASATQLEVDLSSILHPATHVGAGSLYGVTEKLPADVSALITPLHPNMFTNPAADVQQHSGDAIVVAGRVAPAGATVTIRLADWFPGWYSFTDMNDWFDKMSQTVSRKKTAGLTNVYAYEIWNEPNGTWTTGKPMSFNEFWRQSYVKLRQLDPGVKITGPSLAGYNQSYLKDFLTFCKANACLPDIVGWHDGPHIANNVQSYRAMEKQLGIGPLPITINEYSGDGRIDDEGRPGASAPIIAQLERSGVETACITYWDVPHPGRLGSLLATDTERNGGWFFYQWYGEMTGNMVATKPAASDGVALDGFASVDARTRSASVVAGGKNDGTIDIVVKGFGASGIFGSAVHAVVEHTPFVNRSTVVKATDVVSTADMAITSDQIKVSIGHANGNDGYRLRVTAMGAGATSDAGAAGAGGAAGASGAAGAGGVATSGGTSGVGGSIQTGGVPVTSGGNSAAGGSATSTSSGGATMGGVPSSGAGATALGAGGASGGAPIGAGVGGEPSDGSKGCGCRTTRASGHSAALIALAALAIARRRRKAARSRRIDEISGIK